KRAKASGMSHQQLSDFASTPETGLPHHADSGMPPARPRYQFVGGHAGGPAQESFPGGHQIGGQTHKFAKTSGPPRFTDDGEGPDNWAERATSDPSFRRGALTAKAKSDGETPMQFTRAHYKS